MEVGELPLLRSLADRFPEIDAIYVEFHSDEDRREIDALLARHYVLFHASVAVPHRGTCGYLRRELSDRAGLEARAIRAAPAPGGPGEGSEPV